MDVAKIYFFSKESVFGVILVRIFHALSGIRTEYGEIRSRITDQNNSE